jgi:hypothetical protein
MAAMILTSWSARLLPPHASAPFLTAFDSASQNAGLTRTPAAWFGVRSHPEFVMGQNVFERAAKQGEDRITLAYAVGGTGFSSTTGFLARLWLQSEGGTVSHLQLWTPMLDFGLLAPNAPTKESAQLERWIEAVTQAFYSSEDSSPLVEAERRQTQLTPDQVLQWAEAHIQQSNLVSPRLESLRIIPAGHRNELPGDYWVVRYASGGKDNPHMTVVNVEDATGEIRVSQRSEGTPAG